MGNSSESADVEVLILVMGQAGCGKSFFINSAAGRNEKRNVSMLGSTKLQSTTCCHPGDPTSKFTLIEIPGFNTTNQPPTDTDILVEAVEFLKKKSSGHIFSGILYLQQIKQQQPQVLTDLLVNDVTKENLLEVFTIHGQSSGGSSEQGKLCFQITPGKEISQQSESAWEIIDKVYKKVGCKKLTVGVVQPGLETAWKRGLESKKVGESDGRAWSWFSSLFC